MVMFRQSRFVIDPIVPELLPGPPARSETVLVRRRKSSTVFNWNKRSRRVSASLPAAPVGSPAAGNREMMFPLSSARANRIFSRTPEETSSRNERGDESDDEALPPTFARMLVWKLWDLVGGVGGTITAVGVALLPACPLPFPTPGLCLIAELRLTPYGTGEQASG